MSVTSDTLIQYGFESRTGNDSTIVNSQKIIRVFRRSTQDGNLASQANRAYADHQIVASGGTFNYNLPALPGGQGMLHVKSLIVEVVASSTGTATIGPSTTNGWTPGIPGNFPLAPGAIIALEYGEPGIVVVPSATEQITITVTGSVEFFLVVHGTDI